MWFVGGREFQRTGLLALAPWDSGFEIPRRHVCVSHVNVLSCLVEASAMNRSFAQGIPNECGASVCTSKTITF